MISYLWTKFLSRAEPRDVKQSQKDASPKNEISSAQDWFFLHSLSESQKQCSFIILRKWAHYHIYHFSLQLPKASCILEYFNSTFWVEVNKYLGEEIYKVPRNNLSIFC